MVEGRKERLLTSVVEGAVEVLLMSLRAIVSPTLFLPRQQLHWDEQHTSLDWETREAHSAPAHSRAMCSAVVV